LERIGTLKVVGSYQFSPLNAYVAAAHPVTSGIIDTALSDLTHSVQVFTLYPSLFKPVTIARNGGDTWKSGGVILPLMEFSDGSRGMPSILALGGFGAVCGNGVVVAGKSVRMETQTTGMDAASTAASRYTATDWWVR
jgi:hypothetical protein